MEEKNDTPEVEQEEQTNEEEESTEEETPETLEPNKEIEELKGEVGKLKRLLNKKNEGNEEAPKKEKTGDFGYGEKAYLKSNGIEKDEFDFVKEAMDDSGKSMDEVLDSKWFKSELNDKREAKKVEEATPSNSKRTNTQTQDSAEYWQAKIDRGEAKLGDIEDVELKRKVVNSRLKSERQKSQFTSNPVVGNAN